MECPSCMVQMVDAECPHCGYQDFRPNVGEGLCRSGSIINTSCELQYCIKRESSDVSLFCPHLDKMGHHSDPRKVTVFCTVLPKEGEVEQ